MPRFPIALLPLLSACISESNLNYIGQVPFGSDCQPSIEPILNEQPPLAVCELSSNDVRPMMIAISEIVLETSGMN